ncbi:MAG: N-acetylmuramoyl-L-alanine amidase (EC [uncultured Sulfurovum sp.]|uniref:N-acetylmuramoyl-L-alanine amidase n=1 Tax=uncultured Sulfurovum sp. TaxID=269237 RepID=A0A6S6RSQ5_9BACT|nr:MAG: N-acetylmuramoyl-L-alanine amidase (EC [uncultured Sulfurovum sp.]
MYILLLVTGFELMAKTDNYLRHTSLSNHQLNLLFKYPVGLVKHFTIKGKGIVKHVYDIDGAALPKTQSISQYKAKGIQAFRIAQYNKQTLRIVIEAKVSMKGNYKITGRKLALFLPFSTTPTLKQTVAQKKIVKKKVLQSYGFNPNRKYRTIVLDAGHGGRDVGASSKKVREKDLTLSMTLKLKNILQKMGYRVLLTRDRDKFMNLKQRTDYVYNRKGSIFVSIHANAAPKKRTKGVRYEGLEVFYLGLRNTKRVRNKRAVYRGRKVYSKSAYKEMVSSWKFSQSRSLAKTVKKNILSHVSRQYKIYDKGIKRKDFWVLLATKMPAILIETGYLTNKNEVKKLTNPHYQTVLMEGVARGINNYYGLY